MHDGIYTDNQKFVQCLIFSAGKFENVKLEPDGLIIQRNYSVHVLKCPVIFGDRGHDFSGDIVGS